MPAPKRPAPPEFYEVAEDIYIYNPESGVAPVAAYRAGDRVVADLVHANGWHDKVRVPADEASAGQPAGKD